MVVRLLLAGNLPEVHERFSAGLCGAMLAWRQGVEHSPIRVLLRNSPVSRIVSASSFDLTRYRERIVDIFLVTDAALPG